MEPEITPLEERIVELAGEHREACCALDKAETELEYFDYKAGEEDAKKTLKLISQHSINEQKPLLKFLREKLGKDGSVDRFQLMSGHAQLMNTANELTRKIERGRGITIDDIEEVKSILSSRIASEQQLFLKIYSLLEPELKEETGSDSERGPNEAGK